MKENNKARSSTNIKIFILFLTYIIMAFFIFFSYYPFNLTKLKINKLSEYDIIAKDNFSFFSESEKNKIFESLNYSIPLYYTKVNKKENEFNNKLNNIMNFIINVSNNHNFLSNYYNFSENVINFIMNNKKLIHLYTNRLVFVYKKLLNDYYIANFTEDINHLKYIELYENNEYIKVENEKIIYYPVEKSFLIDYIKSHKFTTDNNLIEFFSETLINLIEPNIYLDKYKRNSIIEEEIKKSENKKFIQKGEIIVEKNQLITYEIYDKILAYTKFKKDYLRYKLPILLVASLLLYLVFIYKLKNYNKIFFWFDKNFYISISYFILLNIFFLLPSFIEFKFLIPPFLFIFIGALSISFPILYRDEKMSIMILIYGNLFYIFYNSFEIISFVNLITISLLSIYFSKSLKYRNDFFYVGFIIVLINFLFSILYILFNNQLDVNKIALTLFFSVLNGILCVILSSTTIPIMEFLFNIPTKFRLMELINAETSPLLNRLRKEAPGTFQHSNMLGEMCASVAGEIGVDPLLVKAGCYYHDIGKIENPEYFIENQQELNRHNFIKPSISVSVIKSHVKLGVEIGKKYRLPEEVLNFIREHHGTTMISYFYHQAIEMYGDKNVNKEDYEYPGPKPKSKATALVLLADSIEATVRAYYQNNDRFTPKIIEDIIEDITTKRIEQGQFDDCDITMKDINVIKESINKYLLSYYHKRIEYKKSKED